jgi:site-specific DNA-methyltransferase (adenine-specific)
MEGMKQWPDNYFDLAIVDPPYFKGPNEKTFYGNEVSTRGVKRTLYEPIEKWEVPDKHYFEELFRVSKNQIIWGVNYFTHIYDFGPGRIIWDKVNGESSYSDCEVAYCSMHDSTRIFRYMWNGMMQGKSITEGHIMQGNKRLNEVRIHPTQKPVALYKWTLMKYAKQGFRILDSHVGSASSLIACYDGGFEYVGYETDKNMYQTSMERLENHMRQLRWSV